MASLDLENDEDLRNVNEIIVGAFGCIAVARQYPGWQITAEDALKISAPLVQIGKKYPAVLGKVLEYSPVVALSANMVWIVGPRIAADKAYHEMMKAEARSNRTAPPPPVQTQQVGAVPVDAPASTNNVNPSGFPKDLRIFAEAEVE